MVTRLSFQIDSDSDTGSAAGLGSRPRWCIRHRCGKYIRVSTIRTGRFMPMTGSPRFKRFATLALCLPAASLLAGCAWYERKTTTSFAPSAKGFEFRALADSDHKLDDPAAEKWRLRFLKTYLKDNNICPAGYTIRKRSPILRQTEPSGDVYDIFYEGRCNG
jgi:hypothetical protein